MKSVPPFLMDRRMTQPIARCLFLPWDSEFFGVPIARVVSPRLETAQLQAAVHWCNTERISCLYWLADPVESNAKLADHMDFTKIDDRVMMHRILMGSEALEGTDPRIRACETEDIAALKQIAATHHNDSRFHRDDGFDRKRCSALFETWIVHDCAGAADAVWVACVDAKPVGYLSCHVRPGNQGELGLFAVAEEHRCKGLGTALLHRGLRYFAQRGIGEVGLVMQGRDESARRLFAKNRFTITNTQWWYHRWFNREAMVA